jgi:formamidopyrimidine-DNA glycosylase
MPELPDISIYLECLEPRVLGKRLDRVRVVSRSLLRSVDPPVSAAEGRNVTSLRRIGTARQMDTLAHRMTREGST